MENDERSSAQPEETETDERSSAQPEEAETEGGSEMSWGTSQPSADATKPETMPKTFSTAMPGEKDHHQAG